MSESAKVCQGWELLRYTVERSTHQRKTSRLQGDHGSIDEWA